MTCPVCQNDMVRAKATGFGEEYDYCRTCKKELSEMSLKNHIVETRGKIEERPGYPVGTILHYVGPRPPTVAASPIPISLRNYRVEMGTSPCWIDYSSQTVENVHVIDMNTPISKSSIRTCTCGDLTEQNYHLSTPNRYGYIGSAPGINPLGGLAFVPMPQTKVPRAFDHNRDIWNSKNTKCGPARTLNKTAHAFITVAGFPSAHAVCECGELFWPGP